MAGGTLHELVLIHLFSVSRARFVFSFEFRYPYFELIIVAAFLLRTHDMIGRHKTGDELL
jgi:hypothetical protein